MNFNKLLKSIFGDKSSRDMKLIQPLVEKVKAAYPEIAMPYVQEQHKYARTYRIQQTSRKPR